MAKALFEALEKGCLAGDGASCRDAERAYLRGERLARDPARARALAERGCADALTEGCTELGFLYAEFRESHFGQKIVQCRCDEVIQSLGIARRFARPLRAMLLYSQRNRKPAQARQG